MNTQTAERALERGTITVQHIFPAKAQGKSAYIKDVDGMMFGIWPDKLGLINVGEAYEIEFSANVKNGTTYRDIKAARMISKPGPAPEQFTGGRDERQPERSAPSQRIEPQRPATSPNGNGAGQYYRPTSPKDSERMFCCSILNAFIATGRIDCARDHLTAAINELRAAYAATFGQQDQN